MRGEPGWPVGIARCGWVASGQCLALPVRRSLPAHRSRKRRNRPQIEWAALLEFAGGEQITDRGLDLGVRVHHDRTGLVVHVADRQRSA